jgi:hypothetical protein
VVPPSGVKKNQTSIALAVVVRERDAAPPGNFIVAPEPTKATVLPGVASFVKISVNEDAPDDTGKRKVIVALSLSVAENTLPLVKSRLMAFAPAKFP